MATHRHASSEDLPLHFRTSEDKSFRFFDLPSLVQENILRQYVPVLTKIHTLGQIPQFSKLLDCRLSWMNVSDEFAQLIPILRSLQKGLYVRDDDLPDHGYYVSRETSGNTFTFTLCCISQRMKAHYSHRIWKINVSIPTSNLVTFLKFFSKYYCPATQKSILAYRFNNSFIYVNRPASVAMGFDGEKKKIKNNKCILVDVFEHPWFKPNGVVLKLEEDTDADLIIGRAIYTLDSRSLESSILSDDYDDGYFIPDDWKAGSIPIARKVCKIEISLEGKSEIAVHVSTTNPDIGWQFNNGDSLNMLSEKIIQELWHLKKTL